MTASLDSISPAPRYCRRAVAVQWLRHRFFGDRKSIPYLQTEFSEAGGQYSPDGKWVAYFSDESGNNEVCVRSILPTGGKLLVSPSGGMRPVWRRDGKEIFYLSTAGELMAAKV